VLAVLIFRIFRPAEAGAEHPLSTVLYVRMHAVLCCAILDVVRALSAFRSLLECRVTAIWILLLAALGRHG